MFTAAPDSDKTGNADFLVPGTLRPPGPIGRAVRFFFGLGTLWFVVVLLFQEGPGRWMNIDSADDLTGDPGMVVGILFGLWFFNEVINIGWSRRWGWRPLVVILGSLGLVGAVSYLLDGSPWGPPLGGLLFVWLVYTYAHLSVSFFLAALLSTPGCEMRSIPDLIGRARGEAVPEHICPSPLHQLDRWEQRRLGDIHP